MKIAEDLVHRLEEAGPWPAPSLLEAVLSQGEHAVAPLLTVLRRIVNGQASDSTLFYAASLLGTLGAREAIGPLCELFYYMDEKRLESAAEALGHLGEPAIGPALKLFGDRTLHWNVRLLAAEAAATAAGIDPDLRARVAEPLRQKLAEYVARGEKLSVQQSDRATSLVEYLADLCDPLARPLIDTAFSLAIVDEWVVGPDDVEHAYRGKVRAADRDAREWLRSYHRQYRSHLALEILRNSPAQGVMATVSSGG
jgi:hypothetical protein